MRSDGSNDGKMRMGTTRQEAKKRKELLLTGLKGFILQQPSFSQWLAVGITAGHVDDPLYLPQP